MDVAATFQEFRTWAFRSVSGNFPDAHCWLKRAMASAQGRVLDFTLTPEGLKCPHVQKGKPRLQTEDAPATAEVVGLPRPCSEHSGSADH